MRKKPIQKSIRMTQETYDFVNGFDGNGFNEKLANMIYFFERQKADIEEEIQEKEKELELLNKKIEEKQETADRIREIFQTLNSIYWEIRNKD